MLDDFHESTRSVGLMGVLLGLFVVAGFCGLGMAVMSGSSQSGPSIEARLHDQAVNIQYTKEELKEKATRLEEIAGHREIAAVLKQKDEAKLAEAEGIAVLEEEVTDAQGEVDAILLDFEEYRQKYRDNERKLAIGEILDLSATKGSSFKECKVLAISPLHLRVMRSAGPVGIP